MELDSFTYLSQLGRLTDFLLSSPFIMKTMFSSGKRTGPTLQRRKKRKRLLLYCLLEILGPEHNHDNCSSAIRGLSTQRQLQPEERNGRQKSEVENYQEVGDFAACVVKIDPVPQTTAREAHSAAGHTWTSHLALDCSYYSLQPFSMTLDRKITKCNALVT